MELNGIVQSLDNKSILVTGSTGFLSKTTSGCVSKSVIRVQPNLKQLFLLLRPADSSSATQHLQNNVTGKEVFRVLRKKHGLGFDTFISEKVTPVFGDIGLENLGIEDSGLKKKMNKEVDIIRRGVNTMGAKHVLDFAEKCENIEMILRISTAYIYTGETPGVILEKPLDIIQTMKKTSKILYISEERKLVQDRLNELKAAQVSKKQETAAMKELGLERDRLYGWPTTYAFTKAMGEMIIGGSLKAIKRKFPVVIARPTLISSTYKEPFPGRLETDNVIVLLGDNGRSFDPFVVYCGRGKFPCFLGNHESFFDIVNMVVNAVIVAMMTHMKSNNRSFSGNDDDDQYIYHMCSSANRQQMNLIKVVKYTYDYFCKNPWMDKYGNAVEILKPVFFPSMDSFQQHVYDNYLLPKKVS
ncbi:hypothetical protein MKW98_005809 [Papaver atlanticum]|uniref:Fatty acyl-CoA reductase n=1 Tax=Papaver atlanticum TaxID=357466 RepID=A0AAD4XYE4_9MAGN|nr:hypothetical protein MKW98_005809 [Papaver atlanticum]